MLRTALVALSFISLSTLPASCSNDGGGGAAPAKQGKQASGEELTAIRATLEQIRDAMPPLAELAEKPCPDDQIATWSPDDKTRTLALTSYKELLRKTGAPIPDEVRSPATDSMNSTMMRWIQPAASQSRVDKRLAARWQRTHYLAVLRKATESGPSAGAAVGGKFAGGSFDGWLVYFRTETAQPICAARVQARSSSATGFSAKVGARADEVQATAEHAVKQDLRRQVGRALVAATERVSKSLKLLNPAL